MDRRNPNAVVRVQRDANGVPIVASIGSSRLIVNDLTSATFFELDETDADDPTLSASYTPIKLT